MAVTLKGLVIEGDADPINHPAVTLKGLVIECGQGSPFDVAPLAIITTAIDSGQVGVAYVGQVRASGGREAYSFAVTAGSLPAGLSLAAATGNISGTPTTAATSNFTVTVTDAAGSTDAQAFTVAVYGEALAVATLALDNAQLGVAYDTQLAAKGGSGTYTWSVIVGALPAWASMTAAGRITGTPNALGTTSFTVQATDTVGSTASKALAIAVNGSNLAVETAALDDAQMLVAYHAELEASGGVGAHTWSIVIGSLPSWASLDSGTGVISGTPGSQENGSFTVQAMDSVGGTATKALTITVDPAAGGGGQTAGSVGEPPPQIGV